MRFRAAVMKADAVPPERREDWVAKRVEEGVDVLVCHPRLVQTGLDLAAPGARTVGSGHRRPRTPPRSEGQVVGRPILGGLHHQYERLAA